jgi:hypothetical protein
LGIEVTGANGEGAAVVWTTGSTAEIVAVTGACVVAGAAVVVGAAVVAGTDVVAGAAVVAGTLITTVTGSAGSVK